MTSLTVLFDWRGAPHRVCRQTFGDAARASGWQQTEDEDEVARSLTILRFRRGKLGAFVALCESARSTCGHPRFFDCASYVDGVQVMHS
jgi:hypothetical protein